ncbi:MAG TPA: hypothetical protein VGR08_14995, partial [Thermomicrobiales bacterium]|nr:hypothetical protein [Thermomicrobiales bacterium]
MIEGPHPLSRCATVYVRERPINGFVIVYAVDPYNGYTAIRFRHPSTSAPAMISASTSPDGSCCLSGHILELSHAFVSASAVAGSEPPDDLAF